MEMRRRRRAPGREASDVSAEVRTAYGVVVAAVMKFILILCFGRMGRIFQMTNVLFPCPVSLTGTPKLLDDGDRKNVTTGTEPGSVSSNTRYGYRVERHGH